MSEPDPQDPNRSLLDQYHQVRALTETLAAPLSAEDQTVQSMPDVSPTKWHRGHTSWFFETFVLAPHVRDYQLCDTAYPYIFNSYYEAVGKRHPRPERGLISRPGAQAVGAYRAHVDAAMDTLLDHGSPAPADAGCSVETVEDLVVLGLHHEQQHQELLLMDIKHVLWSNPLRPAYTAGLAPGPVAPGGPEQSWHRHSGGPAEIGHGGVGFAFDNEAPRHQVVLAPFALANRPVTCGEWLEFIGDGGYGRPELWLSDGWALSQAQGWRAPLYWSPAGETAGRVGDAGSPAGAGDAGDPAAWTIFTLGGERPVDPGEPVCHLSYYEADAFAHWAGCRLPTEAEWEAVASTRPVEGNLLDTTRLHPAAPTVAGGGSGSGFYGDVWEWTSSAYAPYPGFRPAPGAVGEYNGKFMVNQYVLRGGCCVTPPGHVRPTYRNFFPAMARWPFTGVRLARDL